MVGKSLTDSATLQGILMQAPMLAINISVNCILLTGAMKVLQEELVATTVPPESSKTYRLNLSYGLFYKVCVSWCVKCICVCVIAFMIRRFYVIVNSFK